jgi:hypothetical protein
MYYDTNFASEYTSIKPRITKEKGLEVSKVYYDIS